MGSRTSVPLFALSLAAFFVLPLVASAHSIPYFGPVIEDSWNQCPLGWGALINVINNLITIGISIGIVFVAPLSFAYAGFLLVLNPTSLGSIEKGKSIFVNTVIGIVVALAAWIIVDAVMAVLYDPSAAGGAWYSLINSGGVDPCIKQASSLNSLNPSAGQSPACPSGKTCQGGVCYLAPQTCGSNTCANGQVCGKDGQTCVYPAGAVCGNTTCLPTQTCDSSSGKPTCVDPQSCSYSADITGIGATGKFLSFGSGPCDAGTVASAAQQSNNSLTATQASTFACIAKYEDSCQIAPDPPNYCWNKDCNNPSAPGAASTAAGAFQVLLSKNSSCYDNSTCESAGGVSGPLNCASAFTPNGYQKTDAASQQKIQQCLNAANQLSCSTAAAICLLNQNGGSFSPWTTDKHSAGQAQCLKISGQ